jgi:hypothetical protein
MVADFRQEVSIGERRNHNPDVVLQILCLDVVRMMNLTPPVRTGQETIGVKQVQSCDEIPDYRRAG